MHIQVVTFNIKDMSDGEYRKMCDEEAPTFGKMPGLISKVWLEDKTANTYGGVYTWRDRSAMEAYITSDYFKGIASSPNLTNITSRDFGVLDGPTMVSHGFATVSA